METQPQVRPFRSARSMALERKARDSIVPFLQSRGFMDVAEQRRTTGTATAHQVTAALPSGAPMTARVKLCWHRSDRNPREMLYSATQLRARRLEAGWDATLVHFVDSSRKHGITHLLVAQPEQVGISLAALIPIAAVRDIWWRQHDVSKELIDRRQLGRQSKNHAANGHSPTLWLQDDRTPAGSLVADELWDFPGVVDLTFAPAPGGDDTYDDYPGLLSDIGHDGAGRVLVTQSRVPRSRRVRERVRHRAGGVCERCNDSRPYPNFLDVHHIMGVEASDRVWTCVAICPNCHREAHVAPHAEAINAELMSFAARFKPAGEVRTRGRGTSGHGAGRGG